MTPDEVVKVLEELSTKYLIPNSKQREALQSAIFLLQDYQKLRERVNKEQLWGFLISIWNVNKKFYDAADLDDLAEQIVTYLQQPTEQKGK